MAVTEIFRKRLKQARKQAGVTQKELAAWCEVSSPTVSDWESGKISPQLDRLESISKKLGKPVSWFFLQDEARQESGQDYDWFQAHKTTVHAWNDAERMLTRLRDLASLAKLTAIYAALVGLVEGIGGEEAADFDLHDFEKTAGFTVLDQETLADPATLASLRWNYSVCLESFSDALQGDLRLRLEEYWQRGDRPVTLDELEGKRFWEKSEEH